MISYYLNFSKLFFKKKSRIFCLALVDLCGLRAVSSCREWGLLFVVVLRLLIAVASPVEEHGLEGTRAQ